MSRFLPGRSRLAVLVIALFFGLLAWPLLPARAQARSVVWLRLDTDIVGLDNGDLRITETNAIYFIGGPFTFGYRDIDTARLERIFDVRATEDGQPLRVESDPVERVSGCDWCGLSDRLTRHARAHTQGGRGAHAAGCLQALSGPHREIRQCAVCRRSVQSLFALRDCVWAGAELGQQVRRCQCAGTGLVHPAPAAVGNPGRARCRAGHVHRHGATIGRAVVSRITIDTPRAIEP